MYKGPITDVDVHHTWNSDSEVTPYLSKHLRDYFDARGKLSVDPPLRNHLLRNGSLVRRDRLRSNGRRLGSDYEAMREQLLDPLNIERVHLTFNVGWQSGFHNPDIAVDLCRASNDWSLDNWLDGRDHRLYGAIQVSTVLPEQAAREIRRVAVNERFVSVLMVANPLLRPFGDPIYHPIFEAAEECGLAITIHGGTELLTKGTAASGSAMSMLEQYALLPNPGMTYMTSLIAHGVFEKYPRLRVLFNEFGCEWLPWLMWSLDAHYKLLRRENGLVRDLPSEYFRRHIWMSLQPLTSGAADSGNVAQLLQSFGGLEDRLCFGTDYPHWDDDRPTYVAARLPRSWHRKIFSENAANCLRWPTRTVATASDFKSQSVS